MSVRNHIVINNLFTVSLFLSLCKIEKELGFFHIIFAQILTAHNICLTHTRPSILIYANALGYILSIKVEFVMQKHDVNLFYVLLYMGRGSKKYNFQKIDTDK